MDPEKKYLEEKVKKLEEKLIEMEVDKRVEERMRYNNRKKKCYNGDDCICGGIPVDRRSVDDY